MSAASGTGPSGALPSSVLATGIRMAGLGRLLVYGLTALVVAVLVLSYCAYCLGRLSDGLDAISGASATQPLTRPAPRP